MLEQFTWQQFLLAAGALSLLWYTAVILLYYRGDITKFKPKNRQKPPELFEQDWENLPKEEPEEDTLMGSIREPDGVTTTGMEELRFAPRDTDNPDAHRDTQFGAVPDMMEELKQIFTILENEGGTKEDFISLFTLVSAKYPQIKGTPSQKALNEHIRNNILFPISDEELDNLWQ